jgi:hypothetical protein
LAVCLSRYVPHSTNRNRKYGGYYRFNQLQREFGRLLGCIAPAIGTFGLKPIVRTASIYKAKPV